VGEQEAAYVCDLKREPYAVVRDVGLWPKADMPVRHSNVCFQGVERTSTQTRRMSANDPERTSAQSSSRTNCNPFFVCRAAMLSSLLGASSIPRAYCATQIHPLSR